MIIIFIYLMNIWNPLRELVGVGSGRTKERSHGDSIIRAEERVIPFRIQKYQIQNEDGHLRLLLKLNIHIPN